MKKQLKVLFYVYDFDDEPLGILYISSLLKSKNIITDVVLTKYENYIEITKKFFPDIAAFTVTTGFDNYYLNLAKEIKTINKNIFTIFGGPHCTFYPDFIDNNQQIDVMFRGESEFAVGNFIEKFQNDEDYTGLQNLYVRQNGIIIRNDVMPLIENIDSLPQPDRELLVKYKFYRESSKKDFITGRGCPFNCSYCFNHAFNKMYKGKGKIVRKHSVDYIIKQIQDLRKIAKLNFLQFVDDIFIISPEWLEEFSEKYAKIVNLPFNCNIRVDYVNEKTINLLKKSRCHSVSMGIEAGDENIRNNMLKRNLKDSEIIEACKIIKSSGLRLATQNIVGIPGSSLEKDFKTMRLNYICQSDYAWCTLYQPYPGVELTNLAVSLKLFDGNRDFIAKSFHEDTILNIPNKKETINLHKLFGIGAEFGKFEKIIKFLIKLPFTKVYSFFRKIWNCYCFKCRIAKNITFIEIYWKAYSKKLYD